MDVIFLFKKGKWTKYIFMIMFIMLFLFIPDFRSEVNTKDLGIYLSFFIAAIFIHFISQKDKNWFRLDVLFLLGFSIVYFQWASILVFSSMDLGNLTNVMYALADLNYMNYGTWLSVVGILAWFLGYSSLPIKKKNIVLYKIKYQKLLLVSAVLFILFVLMAGSNFLSGGIYKGQGGSSTGDGISVYFQLLFGIAILVLTVIVILNNKDLSRVNIITWFYKLDKKYLFLAGVYVILFLSVGDRSAGMQVAFTFLILFGSIVRPISFKQFSGIIIIGSIILTLIGIGRSVDSGENILIEGANKTEFTSGYDTTMELANSVRTLYHGLSEVPKYHDYFFGKLWRGKLLGIIPLSQNIYLQLSDDKVYELSSQGYITYMRYGLDPPSGEGTSLIVDIYLNFGLVGVLFFLFILGIFMKKLQNELNMQKSFYWIIAAGIFASISFYMGRADLFVGLRPIIWGIILTVFLVKYRKVIV